MRVATAPLHAEPDDRRSGFMPLTDHRSVLGPMATIRSPYELLPETSRYRSQFQSFSIESLIGARCNDGFGHGERIAHAAAAAAAAAAAQPAGPLPRTRFDDGGGRPQFALSLDNAFSDASFALQQQQRHVQHMSASFEQPSSLNYFKMLQFQSAAALKMFAPRPLWSYSDGVVVFPRVHAPPQPPPPRFFDDAGSDEVDERVSPDTASSRDEIVDKSYDDDNVGLGGGGGVEEEDSSGRRRPRSDEYLLDLSSGSTGGKGNIFRYYLVKFK